MAVVVAVLATAMTVAGDVEQVEVRRQQCLESTKKEEECFIHLTQLLRKI